MATFKSVRTRAVLASAWVLSALPLTMSHALADTAVKPYLIETGGHYQVTPLLSVGDRVPETSDSSLTYQMVGIPDGLGSQPNGDGTNTLYMNHELNTDLRSEPVVGAPLNRGAIVSKFIVDSQGDVLSGERAYDTVYNEDHLVGPAAQIDNTTPAFGRFCSASLAGTAEGFDRPIFFANEEADALRPTGGPGTFDGRGGQTVAIFDNEAHTLPKLGRFSKENSLVMRDTGRRTVILSLEDGPTTADSQLYMYVGTKTSGPVAGALSRNGLNNGKLYVFASTTPNKNNELNFQEGTISGRWKEISNAENMGETQLENAADQAGAFGFVRIEDGAFNKTHPSEFFFTTTGGNATEGNALGRVYSLKINDGNPVGSAKLQVVYNADLIVAAGGDIAVSPDNVDTSTTHLMVQEGGTGRATPVITAKGRDYSVWRFALSSGPWSQRVDVSSATRVAQVNPPGRDGITVPPGRWESSGVLDVSASFGADAWLQTLQAHPPTTAPVPNTIEDGQLLLMTPVPAAPPG